MQVNTKLNILIMPNSLYTFRGGERFVLELAVRLKDRFNITIANPVSRLDARNVSRAELERLYDLRGVSIVDLPCMSRRAKVFDREPYAMRALTPLGAIKLARLVKNSDLVYEVSINPMILASVLAAAKLFNKKMIQGVHNFAVYESLTSRSGWQPAAFNSAIGRIHYFHTVSRRDSKMLSSKFGAKVYRIPNPIFRKRTAVRNGKGFECVFVGRFDKSQKGIDLLCEIIENVLPRNRKITFSLVGDGGDATDMVKELCRRYPKNVRLRGFLTGGNLDDAYGSASVLILTSRVETFPMVLLEAQSHGLPSIAFDIDGPNELITGRKQGRLVRGFDTNAFADCILSYYNLWLKKNQYLRLKRQIADEAYARYGADRIVNQISKMFKDVIG
ncbi:MAG: glycosyltransferase [Candidatus Micrarchaeota archaeon]|nr:glycosyltransferase [Candidatus Micrarchaeota archaeon]